MDVILEFMCCVFFVGFCFGGYFECGFSVFFVQSVCFWVVGVVLEIGR